MTGDWFSDAALTLACEVWGWWMFHTGWQVTVLVGLLLIVHPLAARVTTSGWLAAMWSLVPLKLVLSPAFSAGGLGSVDLVLGQYSTVTSASSLPTTASQSLPLPVAGLWLMGIVAWIGLTCRRIRHVRQAARLQPVVAFPGWLGRLAERIALEQGVTPVRLRLADGLVSPALAGCFRPEIWLPAAFLEPARRDWLEAALRHEYAHVARRDPLRRWAWWLLQTAYWFHPAVWLANRRIALVRELCCDARVAARLAAPQRIAYRRSLVEAALWKDSSATGYGLTWFGRRAEILVRLRRLEGDMRGTPARHGLGLALAVLGLSFVPQGTLLGSRPAVDRLRMPAAGQQRSAVHSGSPALTEVELEEMPGCLSRRYLIWARLGDEPPGAASL